MRPSELLASVLLFSTVSAAGPSGWDPVEAINHDIAPLLRRQDDQETTSKFDLSFTGVQGNTATTDTQAEETSTGDSEATSTGDNESQTTDAPEETGSATGSERTTGTAKQTGKSTGTNKSGQSTRTFDARLPAGGVSMITPNAMTSKYYKVKDYVTFAWNYTSLSVTPSYVDVLASCSMNQQTYTIAANVSVEETQTVVWDTGKYQATGTIPLLTETYTLIIHDAAREVTQQAQAGYLGTYNQFTFGMYIPQAYTPMSEWVCATCNGALSQAERQVMWAVLSMAGLTVLSFTWFTGVAGLW
ncbi:hypothetical protein CLAFUW4_11639 [Fulvia fulva]|uniref:DUF7137 domain-containing protein n=1 Tax=Passalora fulva TaxID=5499 RepID=A0A9Q8PCU8_PASFU|nr:uncharacterized protein CLAFUR5_10685 [Fulvia fulva]KAK4619779.1 hypothetical protein CLAFUR4_11644 [Fulvia fulva]KAK4620581.1 hypothetical protein CLAFUR0_11654 [Fulvia fulva]UJO20119.1 hypothetical protein CLAFUR5_10685 [Fulvia fulva]WPV17175.1 hypothetical protein CLAFUW4_11639 [Fulvia fulva]WPV32675.1 hypothetical protein CLAFUW7_11644 [Fulvia fulva]